MNIHIILVHFPIALLTLYSIFEILSLTPLGTKSYWFSFKLLLLSSGVILSIPTYLSGELLESIYGENRTIEVHSTFASMTILVFAFLLIIYSAKILDSKISSLNQISSTLIKTVAKMNLKRITIPLAILGLILLTITGAIGGGMAHGKNTDPVAKMIFELFNL